LELRQNSRYQIGSVVKAAGLIKEEAIKETPNAMINRAFKSILNLDFRHFPQQKAAWLSESHEGIR
jgi:hypothetical protein